MKNKYNNSKRKGMKLGTLIGVVFIVMFTIVASTYMNPRMTPEGPVIEIDSSSWHTIFRGAVAEADPGTGASGWLSTFLLDYGETPGTVLANNATDWEGLLGSTVHGYQDVNATQNNGKSDDAFYPVIRARFNQSHCASGGVFNDGRVRCYITISGIGDDETNQLMTKVVSYNTTNHAFLYVNFYYDDGDGHTIPDDDEMFWNCTIQAKY